MTLLESVRVSQGFLKEDPSADDILQPNIDAVAEYLKAGGATDAMIASARGVKCVCVGVTDLWTNTPGAGDFSPMFFRLACQLTMGVPT